MRVPFRWPERLETPILLALLLALLAASAGMTRLGQPLVTPTSPRGIVDFELAATRARADAILASWDERARAAARTQTFWDDVLYVPLYVLTLSTWAAWGARRAPGRRTSSLGVALAWSMPVAGVLDWIENRQLLAQLADGADAARAAWAAACAAPKFAIVLATIAYGLLVAAHVGLRRLWPRPGVP